MTFAEVPNGHLFRIRRWGGEKCSCLIRKTGDYDYRYLVYCGEHALHAQLGVTLVLTDPTSWAVDYDPFVAMVESI